MAADGGGGGIPGEGKLRSYVERIERLNEDLKAVKIDLGEVFSEAGDDGFDKSILRIVIKRRSQDPAKRMLQESLVDLYEAALDGRRPSKPMPPPGKAESPEAPGLFDGEPGEGTAPPSADPAKPFVPPPQDDVMTAREKGRDAAKAAQPITSNPYAAGTPNRVHWDEAWCAETGTDGMDVPEAWKRKSDQKKPGDAP